MGKKRTEKENEILKQIGLKLKKYRTNKGLTQKQLSEHIHIKLNDISLYENGKRDISIITLNKFCDFYKINISSIISIPKQTNHTNIIEGITTLKKLTTSFSVTANSIINQLEDIK